MAEHILVPGSITFDLAAPFSQQGIYNAIRTAYPTSPEYTVVSIAVPLVYINCRDFGIINPLEELKNAASRLYTYFMQYYIQPIWNAFYSLYEVLKNLGLAVLDITIPIFNLTIADLFDPNIYDRVKQAVLNIYYSAREQLLQILDLLGIKWPPFAGIGAIELEIEYIVESIVNSLWGFVIKAIKSVITLISTGLKLWETIYNQSIPTWSQIWDGAKDAVLGFIADLLTNVPTIKQIEVAIIAFARAIYGKLEVTYQEIMDAMANFTFLIFGKPFDWTLPWNPNINAPELDFQKMLNSILIYCKNFIFNVIKSFVNAVLAVLEFFGISLANLATINIPLTFCAVKNE